MNKQSHVKKMNSYGERNRNIFFNLNPSEYALATDPENPNLNKYVRYRKKRQFELLLKYLRPKQKDKILIVGTGSGREIKVLKHYVNKLYGIDISPSFINYCNDEYRGLFEGVVCDIEKEKSIYPDNYFDKIVCLNTIVFFENDGVEFFFSEISRMIKNNGLVFVFILNKLFPFSSYLQSKIYSRSEEQPIYYYRSPLFYKRCYNKYNFFALESEGGHFYFDSKYRINRAIFSKRHYNLIKRITENLSKTPLKFFFRDLFLLLEYRN